MRYRYPDFYFDFECIADRCRHSCCRDWEIELDDSTVEMYKALPEAEASRILSKLKQDDGGMCMQLTPDGRCPFLEDSGLCRLILEYGEDYISDICTEHPRFYNELGNCLEAGLGLCCEEACRLLLEGEEPLCFIEEDDGEAFEAQEAVEKVVLEFRDECALVLEENGAAAFAKLEALLCGDRQLPAAAEAAQFCLGLEVLDAGWTALLKKIAGLPGAVGLPKADVKTGRLFNYLLYRHSAEARSREELQTAGMFCLFALVLINGAWACGTEEAEAVRMFSSEIEYSDENPRLIKEYLRRTH